MKIIKPAKLCPGDTIGIVASSLPVLPSFRENYERGKKVLSDLGFKIKEGKTIDMIRWWAAGTPQEVADDINSMFADKSIKAIMAQTGGYSASSVLEYLDYELISNNIKPYIGMSDVTNFHMAFLTKCNMVGFHMDDVTFGLGHAWGEDEEYLAEFNKNIFTRFLMQVEAPKVINPLTEWEEWRKGSASGHLMGGNLHLFANLLGTEYFPSQESFNGAILFWEEVGQPLHNIARFLTHLKYSGILENVSGMLIGKITYIKPAREKEVVEPEVKEMILDILKDYKFPIMANLDFGHFTVNIPMPIGVKVSFDTSKKELKFLEGAVI
ncbi:MAG: LD-carboxypeptidase [Candidatus Daviesbacteria bacterium]|nr:LD-carboxypeptidase [Candidatus Daviesbacteria bacterium]